MNIFRPLRNGAMIVACVLLVAGCKPKQPQPAPQPAAIDYTQVAVPAFDADSAFGFVAAQIAFGHRHPGTKGHERCAAYLAETMRRWCDTVIVQPFETTLWDGQKVSGKNIIASLAPQRERRVPTGIRANGLTTTRIRTTGAGLCWVPTTVPAAWAC